jgi:virginiamycin B lyase
MKRRHHAGPVAAFFSRMIVRSRINRVRRVQRSFDQLESRRLLATVTEFSVPSGVGANPDGMTAGPGNSIWFTEFGADKIGTIDPVSHAISEFSVPTAGAEPFRIALGPDGNLWFTEYGANQIGMFNPATDNFAEYPLPTAGALPFGITAGTNNLVWFTESSGNQIGSIDTATGKIKEYPIPTMNSVPEGITSAGGNIYFTEGQGNQIAKFNTTAHTFSEHLLPTAGAQPYGIALGSGGGNLYFTEYAGNQIGVYNLSTSSFSKFITIPTSNSQPTEITAAPGGKIWFTQSKTNQVAMLNTQTDAIHEFSPSAANAGPRGIAAASDGSIWFAELNTGKVATIVRNLVVTSTLPSALAPGETFGVTVAVEYDSGLVDTGYQGNVTLALSGASAGNSLGGTTTVTAVNGVASFDGLSLSAPGAYSIQVTSGASALATIGPLNVTGLSSSSGNGAPAPTVIGEHLLVSGKGKNRYVSGIVLTFSSALNPVTAQNSSNYAVTQATAAGAARAVKLIRLHAIYKTANKSVKLTFTGKPRFAAGGQLRIVASGSSGLASPSGVHLEGNLGNSPGSSALYTILPGGQGITG